VSHIFKISFCKIGYNFVIVALLIYFIFSDKISCAQSLTGMSGGYSIPTAELQKDKSVWFGYSFLNKKYNKVWNDDPRNVHIGYATINYLPFLEIGLRVSYPEGANQEGDKKYIGDRMISARIKPLNEGKWHPSVVIGLQGFYTTTDEGSASYFNSTYLVITKNFAINKVFKNVGLSLGYGSDVMPASTYQFIGLFGGIKITPQYLGFLELMLEYDANNWNIGSRITILKHIIILAGFEGMDSFSGGISYRFMLP